MIKLTGNEHLLDAVFEYCEDIITVKDLNLRYVAYNKAFLKHIGIEDGNAVLGKTVQEIVPKSACDVIEENVRKVITELKPCSYTFVLNKDGCSKYVKQTATPVIRNGVLTNILMVSSDITNEECLNEKLIEKNYQLNTLLEYLPFFVYMKDKNRKLIVATEKSRNFVENGVDNLSADIRLDIPTATEQAANEDNYVLQNKKYLSKEKTAIDINGKTHWYRIHKAPILTENNDINGLVTIAKNIDKEKQLETQKNLFLATLSHDLKNPMQAQISSLNMLYRQLVGKMNDDQKEIFELIIESSIYMKTMLCTLLKTCKESDGAIQLERKNFDMKKIINRAVKEIKELAACKKITLSVSSISDENFVFADENQMRRVV
ncbi:MAG: PAS domain S-box protein [bacterium]|nr:PAS domain S-box protein [bacterium]